MTDVISQLQAVGLLLEGAPEYGRLVRCKVEGDKGRKESGWYVLYELRLDSGELVTVGRCGNWKTMGDESIKIEFDKPLNDGERRRLQEQTEKLRTQAANEKQSRAVQAAQRAKATWDKLPETGSSDYLKRKQVGAYGVRFARGGVVVVPVRNIAGELVGLQFIQGDGTKKFLTGTPKRGAFHSIGKISAKAPLCIAEGYATGASIHAAVGWPVAVAFDAGNLSSVADSLRKKYPTQKILLCADNDASTPGNPGKTKATEAAALIGAGVFVPDFHSSPPGPGGSGVRSTGQV